MVPALLTSTHYTTSTLYSTYQPEPATTSNSLSFPRTTISPSLPSPVLSDHSSNSNGSGSGSLTPTQSRLAPPPSASALMFAQRKLSRKPSNSTLRVQPSLPDILESPKTPTMDMSTILRVPGTGRPLSVLSEVSVASDGSDGSLATIDAYKFRFLDDDSESVVEGSIFDGGDEEEDFKRAERAFAGVKQKLCAFENNIAKARDVLLSPPLAPSPTQVSSPTPTPRSVPQSSSSDRAQPSGIKTLGRIPLSLNFHNRTVSDSASWRFAGAHRRKDSNSTMTSSASDHFTDAHTTYRANSAMSNRSRSSSRASATQVKELEDQMNSLKGRLTQLTEKTRRESLRRRSMNNLRTPLNNIFHQREPAAAPTNDVASPVSYHTALDDGSDAGSDEGSRAGTPKPYQTIRKTMSYEELGYDIAFSAPGEEAPCLINSPRRNRVQEYRSASSSGSSRSSGTNTPVMPSHQKTRGGFHRNNSTSSIGSFETAMEDYEEPTVMTPLTQRPHHRRIASMPKTAAPPVVTRDPMRAVVNTITGGSNSHDDGYHSGPSTPQGSDEGVYLHIQGKDEVKTIPLTKETLSQVEPVLPVPSSASRAMSAANSIIGAENDELALKLPIEDRELVESLCDQLGKVCCKLEIARAPAERAEIRRRMEVALMVLHGTTHLLS
ncbi:hypothetical protein Dda_5981 [Drechslerella dactyloides]|uniref:Uncharacterized protein n=1 Tax=Drechslerella dactyloides TaxID=74499 RepID=A0AAD6IW77_DREDA|nr:hypothetical protein Dda_5981 [Drechslerella dactyloides]